jgi:hypothetical protein
MGASYKGRISSGKSNGGSERPRRHARFRLIALKFAHISGLFIFLSLLLKQKE